MVWGVYEGFEANVRGEMAVVKGDPYLGKKGGLEVLGYVFDIETGMAEEVVMD